MEANTVWFENTNGVSRKISQTDAEKVALLIGGFGKDCQFSWDVTYGGDNRQQRLCLTVCLCCKNNPKCNQFAGKLRWALCWPVFGFWCSLFCAQTCAQIRHTTAMQRHTTVRRRLVGERRKRGFAVVRLLVDCSTWIGRAKVRLRQRWCGQEDSLCWCSSGREWLSSRMRSGAFSWWPVGRERETGSLTTTHLLLLFANAPSFNGESTRAGQWLWNASLNLVDSSQTCLCKECHMWIR